MGRFSILSRKAHVEPEAVPVLAEEATIAVVNEGPREALRFPAANSGKSLAEIAQLDLEAALQLLAERAQYITGASGAAIALRDGTRIICRASAGPSAPELGAHLQIDSGLSGESIRTKEILRCDDAETDTRVNRASCRGLGIASVVVLPLLHEEEVNGVFELFSSRANAFEERDITALERLAGMIQTAIQHATAAKQAEREEPLTEAATPAAPEIKVLPEVEELKAAPALTLAAPQETAEAVVETKSDDEAALLTPVEVSAVVEQPVIAPALTARGNIGQCGACGFPISQGRTLCLDCEAGQSSADANAGFLAQFQTEESWIASHKYLLGILVVVLATIVVLLKFR